MSAPLSSPIVFPSSCVPVTASDFTKCLSFDEGASDFVSTSTSVLSSDVTVRRLYHMFQEWMSKIGGKKKQGAGAIGLSVTTTNFGVIARDIDIARKECVWSLLTQVYDQTIEIRYITNRLSSTSSVPLMLEWVFCVLFFAA